MTRFTLNRSSKDTQPTLLDSPYLRMGLRICELHSCHRHSRLGSFFFPFWFCLLFLFAFPLSCNLLASVSFNNNRKSNPPLVRKAIVAAHERDRGEAIHLQCVIISITRFAENN